MQASRFQFLFQLNPLPISSLMAFTLVQKLELIEEYAVHCTKPQRWPFIFMFLEPLDQEGMSFFNFHRF